jgi:hypothetical protein
MIRTVGLGTSGAKGPLSTRHFGTAEAGLFLTGKERRRKEEAGPSPIRASCVWAQDDTKSDCERQRQKQMPKTDP